MSKIRIKTLLTLLITLVVTASGCKKDSTGSSPDFANLGLEQLIINNRALILDATGHPTNIKDFEEMCITGYTNATFLREYEISTLNRNNSNKVHATSRFDDVTIEIETGSSSSPTHAITATRPDYKEKVIYRVSFINTSAQ